MWCIPNEPGDDLFVERASKLEPGDERRHARIVRVHPASHDPNHAVPLEAGVIGLTPGRFARLRRQPTSGTEQGSERW